MQHLEISQEEDNGEGVEERMVGASRPLLNPVILAVSVIARLATLKLINLQDLESPRVEWGKVLSREKRNRFRCRYIAM